MPCRLFDLLTHIIVDFHVKDIGDEIKRILIILHLSIESGQVESVGQVVLVDFAEVLIAAR